MSNSSASFCYPDLDESVLTGSYDSLVPFDYGIFLSSHETRGLSPTEVLITPITPTLPDFAKSNQPEQPICIEYPASSDAERLLQLLSGVTPNNIHGEVYWGGPLGNEAW